MGNVSNLAVIVGGGFLSAALALIHFLPFPGLVFFSYFALLPLFLLGLGVGLRPFYGASLLATLLVFIGGGSMAAGEFFLLSVFFPGMLITRILLNRTTSAGNISWYPASLILRDFTLLSLCIALLGFGFYIFLLHGRDIQTVVQPFFAAMDPQGHLGDIQPVLIKLIPVLPGLFAFSWCVMVLVNGALAQGLLVRFQHNLRPSPSLRSLTISPSFMIAFGVCLLLSVVGVGYIDAFGKSGSFVLSFPFFFVGLGMVHQWLNRISYPTLWLTLFYLSLCFLFWPIILVVLLGLLRPWLEKFLSS